MQDETQQSEVEIRKQNLLLAYQNPDNVTLYRYENPTAQYDETREGAVSKKELVGSWFTSNEGDFRTYVKQRQPGGKVVVVRIEKDQLPKYDAEGLEDTKEMDIEKDNFIIPVETQAPTRLEIPLAVKSSNPKKFLFAEWKEVDKFFDSSLTLEKLIERIQSSK